MNSAASTSDRSTIRLHPVRRFQIPRSLAVAALLVFGVWLSDRLRLTAVNSVVATGVCLMATWLAARKQRETIETVCLCLAVVGLGASLRSVRDSAEDGRDIAQLVDQRRVDSDSAVRLKGIVSNIPALDIPGDALSRDSSRPQAPRTLFLVRATSVDQQNEPIAARGLVRVLVEGDATTVLKWGDATAELKWGDATTELKWGDHVELTGQLDLASPPLNPGEFDFQKHVQRTGISAMMFIKHPAAVRIEKSTWWHPEALLSSFRQEVVSALKTNLSPRNRATAEALLLGNRGHLAPDLERDFVASGTMHLLAISGLHVGILYVFLVRIQNLLLVPRTRSLILGGIVCVLYCFLTDLRPSVMRSTVFILLHIVGQICVREMRMGSLIGVTTILLVLFDPSIAFDVGAWLSFLCVGALGWVSERTPPPQDREAPPDALTWQERFREFRSSAQTWLARCYQQMLAVTLLSAPLVATQFHVVSLTGMVINILLIPCTTATLITGYVFVAVGTAVPLLAGIPGFVFETLLSVLNGAVSMSADVRSGFVTIPDLPGWFLPSYYLLLAASALASRSTVRQGLRLTLLLLVTLLFDKVCDAPKSSHLTCTMLSVGHGNATVVEFPDGRVVLFDAGALNRGERTADLISRFLWHRGFRMIDAIVISHPDADHYNAAVSLMDRLPIGQLVITSQFARSEAADVQAVIDSAAFLDLPCLIALDGDRLQIGDAAVDFQQAELNEDGDHADNANSLVSIVTYAGRRICLPGDLEGAGAKQLMPSLPQCDVLISPHHGSPAANPAELAHQLQPKHVVVSARDERRKTILEQIYAKSDVLMTSDTGAVTYRISSNGDESVTPFKKEDVSSGDRPALR